MALSLTRLNYWWISVILCVGLCSFLVIYNLFYVSTKISNGKKTSVDMSCVWDGNGPVIYNMKTKMGVNYDAGHWFHMSENFMTQHSILRAKGHLTNATNVYYNFDKDGFINDLNGVTRLMVYLGTVQPKTATQQLHYVYMPAANHHLSEAGSTVVLDNSMFRGQHQAIDMSTSVAPGGRFIPSKTEGDSMKVCAKYMGAIGGMWPTPQRGHWFPNGGDIESFRQKIKDACPPNPEMLKAQAKTKRFKMVIYQRDLSRRLANQEEAIAMLRDRLGGAQWDIQVLMHSSRRTPCELAHVLHNADMLVTPHGFQSMLLMFLPRPAVVFEVFPYRYFKRGYGPFGREYGIVHAGVMSPAMTWHTALLLPFVSTEWCMLTKPCRTYSRDQDVKLTMNGVNKIAEVVDSHPELFGTEEQKKKLDIARDYLY